MADAYNVERSNVNSKYYLITPTQNFIESYNTTVFPFCYTSLIITSYNFSFSDFFRYVIAKFHATINVEKVYPYFKILFLDKDEAQEFCDEVNQRMRLQKLV